MRALQSRERAKVVEVAVDETLAAQIRKIAAFVGELPEALQLRAFELLVSELLAERRDRTAQRIPAKAEDTVLHKEPEETEPDIETKTGEDLVPADVHLKVKKFLEKYALSMDDLNQVFYKESGQVTPLYEDLKTTKLSTMQVRLALLMALQDAIGDGDFSVSGEDVREACKTRKCYDVANYSKNFTASANFFDGLERYDKDNPILRLSEQGKAALADLVKELR
ncbi:MAG: hypothetical protein AABM40_14935 [Chloroflexota bacterium]